MKAKEILNFIGKVFTIIWNATVKTAELLIALLAYAFAGLIALFIVGTLLTMIATMFAGAFILCLKLWTCLLGGFPW